MGGKGSGRTRKQDRWHMFDESVRVKGADVCVRCHRELNEGNHTNKADPSKKVSWR